MRRGLRAALAFVLFAAGCSSGGSSPELKKAPSSINLTSPAFVEGATIPKVYSCDGADRPPILMWSGLPHGTREVAVLVDDPDAPHGTFVHWVVWGIDPTAGKLVTPLPAGIREGRNDFGHRGWGGPCPPKGDKPHHYRFTVLALSAHLPLQSGASPASMGKQANSILLATGRLTGLFGR